MYFYQIRQTMTDDAYDVISAFGQTASLTLQAIAYMTGQSEHATRFILEQMAVFDVAVEDNGLWCLSEEFKASLHQPQV
ncbi:hypothetical protein ACFSFZ_02580 [Mixta tenebrionis]|jgi:hypothetical protein|uniref:Uncharacterized protein n=1 Tax=Mixta tenebrionis TaxID=2562439 RepID=A0A506V237_9GAMM|nr:hypothetical protein [Mixta tenebrionis]TPW39263.1 hypothetical protein FKM52_19295 [Mixta tenebrionis]